MIEVIPLFIIMAIIFTICRDRGRNNPRYRRGSPYYGLKDKAEIQAATDKMNAEIKQRIKDGKARIKAENAARIAAEEEYNRAKAEIAANMERLLAEEAERNARWAAEREAEGRS